jgi:hypothetical protein
MRKSLNDKMATFHMGDIWIGQNALGYVKHNGSKQVYLESIDKNQGLYFDKQVLREHWAWRKVKYQRIMKLLYV